jgi:hypothetical protein
MVDLDSMGAGRQLERRQDALVMGMYELDEVEQRDTRIR